MFPTHPRCLKMGKQRVVLFFWCRGRQHTNSTVQERKKSMTPGKALNGKSYAGNPHVRFDEGDVVSAATPRRGSLLYKRSYSVIQASIIFVLTACGIYNANAAITLSESNLSDTDYVEYSHRGSQTRAYTVSVPNGKTAHVVIERTTYEGLNEDKSKNRFYIYKDNISQSWTGMKYETDVTADTAFAISCKTEAYYHVEIIYDQKTGLPIGHRNVYWTAYYCRYYYTISVTYKGGGGGGGNGSTSSSYANVSFVSDGHVVTSRQFRIGYKYTYSSSLGFPEPVKSGYRFLGWRLPENDGQVVVSTDKVTGDCTFSALWGKSSDIIPITEFGFDTDVSSTKRNDALWLRQPDGSYRSGTTGIGSSAVENGKSTWMTTSITVPSGGRYLSFRYKDSASSDDSLIVMDGTDTLGLIRPNDGWSHAFWDWRIYWLAEGKHNLRWTYKRNDARITSGSNCVWVSSICLTKLAGSGYDDDDSIIGGSRGNNIGGGGSDGGGSDGGSGGGTTVGGSAGGGVVGNWIAGRFNTGFANAQTVLGALYGWSGVSVGTVQMKAGKINAKKGTVKISGSATLLIDGKARKVSAKAVNVALDATGRVFPVTLAFKAPVGEMSFEMAADGTFTLKNGNYAMVDENVGGDWSKLGAKVYVAATGAALPEGTIAELLPDGETVIPKGGKWSFDKAASVKYAKDKATGTFNLVIDDTKGTNRSAMKLTYAPKTGIFKGSFKVYAIQGGKLKKFSVKVIGVVVDGKGTGSATGPNGMRFDVRVE